MITADAMRALGSPEDTFELVDVSPAGSDGYEARLRGRETPDCELQLSVTGEPQIRVRSSMPVPPGVVAMAAKIRAEAARMSDPGAPFAVDPLDSLAQQAKLAAAATIACAVRYDRDPSIEVSAVIWNDGFTRHALNTAVLELLKTRALLTGLFRGLDAGETERPLT